MEIPLWQAESVSGQGISLDTLQSSLLRSFAKTDLAEVLEPMFDQLVTVESLMKAQWLVATAFVELTNDTKSEKVAKSLSQHKQANKFLEALGYTPESYCRQRNVLTDSEFAAMQEGELYIWQLLKHNPVAFLAPLLPIDKNQIN